MLGSVPGWGTKVPEAMWQKRKKESVWDWHKNIYINGKEQTAQK